MKKSDVLKIIEDRIELFEARREGATTPERKAIASAVIVELHIVHRQIESEGTTGR